MSGMAEFFIGLGNKGKLMLGQQKWKENMIMKFGKQSYQRLDDMLVIAVLSESSEQMIYAYAGTSINWNPHLVIGC